MHYPIIVIGAGSGGLVVAIGSAKAGKKVLLIEKGNYGGDCTNFGCIPSKSTIASAEAAHTLRNSKKLGVEAQVDQFNTQPALQRTRDIIQKVRSEEEPEVLAKYGIDTLTGMASFVDSHTLDIETEGGTTIQVTGDTIVLATGSYPVKPKIEGIDSVRYYTNETIFGLSEVPKRLTVLGGGPIGCELAQAYHRLGAEVSLIQHAPHLLMREEPESQEVIEEVFRNEGINFFVQHEPMRISEKDGELSITYCDKKTSEEKTCTATHLLVAAGRLPTIEKLNLEAAGVKTHGRGIEVDGYGRTSQNHIWAIGDCTGRAPFTHMAENAGRRVLYNLLVPRFLWQKEKDPWNIPRVTFTDPEVATVGLTEAQALEKYSPKKLAIYQFPFSKLDRAITTGRTEGFVKIITKKWSSQILGATIVGPRAGEMLLEISTAMYGKIPLRKLANIIHPYPTYSLAIRKAADMWFSQTILPSLKKLTGRK
ncbi:MAG: Dihydrolipoyl dehydrogenase [Chlamydiae bacterium]|nr:Dihydrolipoyl dehydrogenase [Chlamydiota bacterium]